MDLYRYFHPHHNPRLRSTPLRLQELAELQQAAIELTRALKRGQIRMQRACDNEGSYDSGSPSDELGRLKNAIEAADLLVTELVELCRLQPDDDLTTMGQLLVERKNAPGWETWIQLLSQRLHLENDEMQSQLQEKKAG